MIKKTITYDDYNGHEQTEDFYFNLNKGELAELELTAQGGNGLDAMLRRIIGSNDNQVIFDTFKKILRKSYGRRTADGKGFVKRDEYWEEFETSNAYGELVVELITNATMAGEFIKGLVPGKLAAQMDVSALTDTVEDKPKEEDPATFSRDKLMEMSQDDFAALLKRYKGKTTPPNVLQVAMARLGA